jgi:hypothetical protein
LGELKKLGLAQKVRKGQNGFLRQKNLNQMVVAFTGKKRCVPKFCASSDRRRNIWFSFAAKFLKAY